MLVYSLCFFFFISDPSPTEITTLPLHDALPIPGSRLRLGDVRQIGRASGGARASSAGGAAADLGATRDSAAVARSSSAFAARSEEHTSELQSQSNLVCRLLLENKKIYDLLDILH